MFMTDERTDPRKRRERSVMSYAIDVAPECTASIAAEDGSQHGLAGRRYPDLLVSGNPAGSVDALSAGSSEREVATAGKAVVTTDGTGAVDSALKESPTSSHRSATLRRGPALGRLPEPARRTGQAGRHGFLGTSSLKTSGSVSSEPPGNCCTSPDNVTFRDSRQRAESWL